MSVLKKSRSKKKGGRKKLKNTRTVKVSNPIGMLKELGPIIDITYQWKDGFDYSHKFKRKAQPLLAYDEKGKLFIIEGRYTVSDEEGIIDL